MRSASCLFVTALSLLTLGACSSAPIAPPPVIVPIQTPSACLRQCPPIPLPPKAGSDERDVFDWVVRLQSGYGECAGLHRDCSERLKQTNESIIHVSEPAE